MATHGFGYADLLARNAMVRGYEVALAGDFGALTHAQLDKRAAALAANLHARGISAGERVAVFAANRPEILELLGACARLGAVLVLLNTRASAMESAAVLADSGAAMVFVDAALEPLLEHAPAAAARHVIGEAGLLPSGTGGEPAPLRMAVARDAHQPLVAIPTAAVDGRPRLALLSDAAIIHQALQLAHAWSLAPEDRHLCILPLFHMAGLGLTLAVQLAGGASVLMPRFDADAAARTIASSRVSCFASFSPILGAILDAAEAGGHDLGSLRAVTGLEPPDVAARLQRRWPRAVFWSGYGQTETGGLVSLAPAGDGVGSAGRPLPMVALAIETEQGSEAAPGETGEILVRGPGVFSGYWNRPAESAHASRGGWHHTGDLGRLDAQGFLWFEGRAPEKALIKSGGENIYPAEVEQALRAHPAVLEAVVIGVPDVRWGEAVRAVCSLRPGQLVTQEELAGFVGERIARFKRPRDVMFVASLPRCTDGRPDRSAIAAAYGAPIPQIP
jgi:acyl-CoA synthetase (AMP-forming)/AMP-acid ligase II